MKMNNKGFTLIELIATIALLAIISLISYVSIAKILEQSKVRDCETMVNNIKSAVKECISDNRYGGNLNNCKNATYLVSEKYLSGELMSPFDKNKKITNSIEINYQLNENYTCCKVNTLKVTSSSLIKITDDGMGNIGCKAS